MPTLADIIDFFIHPPLGLMTTSTTSPTTIHNPISGMGTFAVHSGAASAYGVLWEVVTVPPYAGHRPGALTIFEDNVLQLAVNYTIAGSTYPAQVVNTGQATGFILFTELLPATLDFYVFPNFEVNLFWLVGV